MRIFLAIPLIATALVGCASMAVTDDAIKQRTASALNLDQSAFIISDRVDDGVETRFVARTKTGKRYNCYVTGTVTYTGRLVSDAICSAPGKSATPSSKCNELLKAANKCN